MHGLIDTVRTSAKIISGNASPFNEFVARPAAITAQAVVAELAATIAAG